MEKHNSQTNSVIKQGVLKIQWRLCGYCDDYLALWKLFFTLHKNEWQQMASSAGRKVSPPTVQAPVGIEDRGTAC